MGYKIIMDSCGELPKQYNDDGRFISVPVELDVNGLRIRDDESCNQQELLALIAQSPVCPKSSCPSPEEYCSTFQTDADNIFVITVSGKLSGSYNSACLGRALYLEEHGGKNIFVIDSQSASGGETQIALKAMELSEAGMTFDEICMELEKFRNEMNTYFVLDNLDTLRKNGRLTGVKSVVASTLSIKPIMGAKKGSIIQIAQSIGIKNTLRKMVGILSQECVEPLKKRVVITHVNAQERAEYVKKLLLEIMDFKDVLILDTSGVNTMYANDGGIIVTV